ncbi:hypothetical protein PHMEG_00031349 [Phytophthora megakarya]|uniref:Uncharacterized protein n=1 Tax=Phytophthora megakarya TaxID=4795 RepID=A0A225UWX7_9STRA|nr:hypothetical protein PHMEG_00031349 [Phytophthora megakarya]
MNFMFSAGVGLCVKEGLVQVPDEETVLISGRGLSHVKQGMAHEIRPKVPDDPTARVPKVDAAVDRMGWTRRSLGHSGLYAWKVPAAIKVVNISNRIVTIDWRTEVAQVVENGFFPRARRYVCVSTRRYRE